MDQLTPMLPHDLLRLNPTAAAWLPAGAPAWAARALCDVPWVVVRRAEVPDALIAVGIRGADRSHRLAWTIPPHIVSETVVPQSLAAMNPARDIPALRALPAVRSIFGDLRWGPTGSVGFELATGVPAATGTSDLDVVVRPAGESSASPGRLRDMYEQLKSLPVRVDCQVETRAGAVALAELISGVNDVLVRTPHGPRLAQRSTVTW